MPLAALPTTIGAMRDRILIRARTGRQAAAGDPLEDWRDVRTCWANAHQVTGAEKYAAAQRGATTTVSFTIRFPPNVRITPDMQIVWEGRVHDVKSFVNPDDKHRFVLIIADELVGVGP